MKRLCSDGSCSQRVCVGMALLAFALPGLLAQSRAFAAPTAGEASEWEKWAAAESTTPKPVLQERKIAKTSRFQVIGPLIGFSDRKDFLNTVLGTTGVRYHFSENHAWEIARVDLGSTSESALASEVRAKTGFNPDAQASGLQVSTSYVYSPIYGKYAWSGESIVHFDLYGSIGPGVRFADKPEPFLQGGLGMNHYILGPHLSVVPEFRLRTYIEQRTGSARVIESIAQLGVGWLF